MIFIQPEGLRVLSRERGLGWDTRAAEQPAKTGKSEQQGENEAQGADRGRRRKDRDRGRSQLLKAEHKNSCLAGRVRSLQSIHLALRFPPVWGVPHYPNSLRAALTRMSPPTTICLFTRLSHEHENSWMFIPNEYHSSARQICIDWLAILLTVCTQTCPTSSVLGVAINAVYWTQNHQLLKMLQTLSAFAFLRSTTCLSGPGMVSDAVFSQYQKVGHAWDHLCNKKFSLKHCAASTTSPWDMKETEAVG